MRGLRSVAACVRSWRCSRRRSSRHRPAPPSSRRHGDPEHRPGRRSGRPRRGDGRDAGRIRSTSRSVRDRRVTAEHVLLGRRRHRGRPIARATSRSTSASTRVFATFDGDDVDCRVAPGLLSSSRTVSNDDGTATQAVQTPIMFRADGPLLPAADDHRRRRRPISSTARPSTSPGAGSRPAPGVQLAHVSRRRTRATTTATPSNDLRCRSRTRRVARGRRRTSPTILNSNGVGSGRLPGRWPASWSRPASSIGSRPRAPHVPRSAFRPDGPLLPPPTLTVEPPDGLVDGQEVQITGTGFRPGFVLLGQCVPGSRPVFERCTTSGQDVDRRTRGNGLRHVHGRGPDPVAGRVRRLPGRAGLHDRGHRLQRRRTRSREVPDRVRSRRVRRRRSRP